MRGFESLILCHKNQIPIRVSGFYFRLGIRTNLNADARWASACRRLDGGNTIQFASGKLVIESHILCIGSADADGEVYRGKQNPSSSASALPMLCEYRRATVPAATIQFASGKRWTNPASSGLTNPFIGNDNTSATEQRRNDQKGNVYNVQH